ncbi:hypothetical protein Tco_0617261 [Tanacetum coccineum]
MSVPNIDDIVSSLLILDSTRWVKPFLLRLIFLLGGLCRDCLPTSTKFDSRGVAFGVDVLPDILFGEEYCSQHYLFQLPLAQSGLTAKCSMVCRFLGSRLEKANLLLKGLGGCFGSWSKGEGKIPTSQESGFDSAFTLSRKEAQTKGEGTREDGALSSTLWLFACDKERPVHSREKPVQALARAVEEEVGHRTMDQFIQQDPFGLQPDYLDQLPKRQYTLSRSNAEAEYRGVANAVVETSSLHNLLREFHALL